MRWIHHLRLSWILGVLLIVGSLLGANRLMQAPRDGETNGKPTPSASDRPSKGGGVVCAGLFAPESEVIPLVPAQQGEVLEVFVKNEQSVKKGDKLLRLDDRLSKSKLEEADAGVEAAEGMLTEAKTALKTYEFSRKAQQKVIMAKKKAREAVEENLVYARRVTAEGISNQLHVVRAGEKQMEGLANEIEAEEIKLQILDLSKPDAKVAQAEANLRRSKALRDQAQLAVDACLMTAPTDGTILSVHTGVGSKFGPQIQKPAFLFYTGGLTIRAEVDQEYVNRIAVGLTATVTDYSDDAQKWTGKVTFVANQFLPKRDMTALTDLLQQSQERALECRITLDPGQPLPRLNQKVRVRIAAN